MYSMYMYLTRRHLHKIIGPDHFGRKPSSAGMHTRKQELVLHKCKVCMFILAGGALFCEVWSESTLLPVSQILCSLPTYIYTYIHT